MEHWGKVECWGEEVWFGKRGHKERFVLGSACIGISKPLELIG